MVIAAASLCFCGTAGAQQPLSGEFATSGMNGYSPQVPVSGFASPASWFNPSRLHLSTSVSVGTGFGGRTEGLQVTSLSYQLAAPLAMQVSVGSTFGNGYRSGSANGNNFFLEGLSLAYHPHPSFQINVDYRDIRSPLQYNSYNSFYTPFGPGIR